MITKKGLTELGFSHRQAESLLQNTEFVLRVKTKNNQEFKELFETIRRVYGVSKTQAAKAILSHPRFASYNHPRVLIDIQRTYGVTKAQATKAVFSYPSFAGLNHSRVLRDMTRAYLPEKEYKTANPEQKKQIIKKLRTQATKAVISQPQFAGLNHSRVLRQALRLGQIIGLNRTEIINAIFDNPVLAGYSQRRNLAAIDAIRNAVNRTGSTKTNKELFKIYQHSLRESPYLVKGSKRSETWWWRQREKPPEKPTSKMGKRIGNKLKKPRRTRVLR